jgi:hypothetical protein
MKRSVILLATSMFMVLAAAAARGETITCTAVDDLHGGGQRKSELTLDVRGGAVVGLLFVVNVSKNGKDGGINTCHIEMAEGDGLSHWSRSGGTIKVYDRKSIEDSHEGSFTEIATLPDGYRLSLTHISRNHYSNDDDIPETVTLKKESQECAMTYKAPPARR